MFNSPQRRRKCFMYCFHICVMRVPNYSLTTTSSPGDVQYTCSHWCCCVPGISDYSGFNKNRGPLSHQGTQWEQVTDPGVDGLIRMNRTLMGVMKWCLRWCSSAERYPLTDRQHHGGRGRGPRSWSICIPVSVWFSFVTLWPQVTWVSAAALWPDG